MDPLQRLPSEIVLRVLDFCSISSLSCLTRSNRVWHEFIDDTHQETIYSSLSKTSHPPGSRDLSFLVDSKSFARYYEGTSTFKDLCKRQTLLARNRNKWEPTTRESVIQIGEDAIWRFRADFKRRIFISTSQQGGLNVTDMKTGSPLWRLPNDQVRPFAHLEYQDGTAVFDRGGNALEVWKTDSKGLTRGEFRQTAILQHDCQTRGFQLSYDTLCVVSIEGEAFVYDMSRDPPKLQSQLEIENDAIGHLDQNEDFVVISMGEKGYHIHDKTSGRLLGIVNPGRCKRLYHIVQPAQPVEDLSTSSNALSALSALPSVHIWPPTSPRKDRLVPIDISEGPLPSSLQGNRITLEQDEWGAALFLGPLLVGISKGGRVMVCTDWKAAIADQSTFETDSYLIEHKSSEDVNFDLGGWLSVRDNRIMFEVEDRVSIVLLDEHGNVDTSQKLKTRPSYSFAKSSATQLGVPVSFMALWDDCIMSTYTTLGWRSQVGQNPGEHRSHLVPMKTIRVISLAPEEGDESAQPPTSSDKEMDENTQAHILEIMSRMSDEDDRTDWTDEDWVNYDPLGPEVDYENLSEDDDEEDELMS